LQGQALQVNSTCKGNKNFIFPAMTSQIFVLPTYA